MLTRKKPRYFTEAELAEVFDITPTAFRQNIRPNIPKEATDNNTKPITHHGRTVIEVFCIHRQKQSTKIKGHLSEEGRLSAREMLYEEQYKIAKMRRMNMSEQLISTVKVRESLSRLQKMLNELGNSFKRIGADKPLELLNELLDRYGHEVSELWERAWKKTK